MDYASPVWSGRVNKKGMDALNVAQRIGAQAIVGAFRTVALARAEAEASVIPLEERLQKHRNMFWIKANTLHHKNPLARIVRRTRPWMKRFSSPLCQMARSMVEFPAKQLPRSGPFCIAPWQKTLEVSVHMGDADNRWAPAEKAIYIFAAASYKKGNIGLGVYHEATAKNGQTYRCRRSLKIGNKTQVLPAEMGLRAIEAAVVFIYNAYTPSMIRFLGPRIQVLEYTIISTNKAAVQAVQNTRRSPHQTLLKSITEKTNAVRTRGGPRIRVQWAPKRDLTFDAPKEAVQLAKKATTNDLQPMAERSFTEARRRACQLITRSNRALNSPLDTALPGKHTKDMYDQMTGKQAAVLCQLRTGMNRLNSYLAKIRAKESALCECDTNTEETMEHYLFECPRWEAYRDELRGDEVERWKDLPYFLGGRSERTTPEGELIDGDPKYWVPNMEAVRRTVEYAMKTGRLQ